MCPVRQPYEGEANVCSSSVYRASASYKTQLHLGGKYFLILVTPSMTQKTKRMAVIDSTCTCSIFKRTFSHTSHIILTPVSHNWDDAFILYICHSDYIFLIIKSPGGYLGLVICICFLLPTNPMKRQKKKQ